ncbi:MULTISPECIES: LysR substrate-binding domain-containing protein [unclassified Beijerinckia]|uniref:LysR substrate-binding domain-containing protein n=1 Tax=unclassified Beijerinckia TaxID=2638183 RepID=UPI0008944801|nr:MULTISPECIES: LysR substrate-binding domain-containing protein [unclassified Beijerinckia]MDH7798284.1 DNA-binding transcriptional LysR family regulator [Beijerinckia sp. GAS462]SED15608.1 DNA-binding transcriptional regulator, LysR family [Beijerinckia sp. 28-YEA-48]
MISSLRMRHLEVVLAVAQAGSMQRAAQRVRLTQPAISKLIGEIESILGAVLFTRSKRGVVLTESGVAFVGRAEALLNDVEQSRSEAVAISKGQRGLLRIGMLSVAEGDILPKSLLAMQKIAPGLRVRIEEGTYAALLDALQRGELDCVIGRLETGLSQVDVQTVALTHPAPSLVARAGHPLARRKRVGLEDLVEWPWVLPRGNAPVRVAIDKIFIQAGLLPPLPLVESTSIRLNYELLSQSDMIGVMTADATADYVARRKLVVLPLAIGALLPPISVMQRAGQRSNVMSLFLDVLKKVGANLA